MSKTKTLTKLTCHQKHEFWLSINGKSVVEVANILTNTRCPQCPSAQINLHGAQWNAIEQS